MCGIAGEFRLRADAPVADWDQISKIMRARGPDDKGHWSDDHSCTMVFRRLSIQDLTQAGHQPMLSADGRYVIVFNGEVYNFKELRRELEAEGWRFQSGSDTEVVLYAMVAWGIKALDRFNGMYAFGFFDTVTKQLLIARDHVGIKPIYYLSGKYGLVFASQFDQILAHPWSRGCDVSQAGLALYLRMAYIPASYSILQSVRMLPPGHYVTIDQQGTVNEYAYYVFPRFQSPDLRGAEADAAVDAAISAAVRRQMVADVPLGAFLSGGIDSPLVIAKMLEHTRDVHAFTIGTQDKATDESIDAKRYADALGVRQTIRHFSRSEAYAILDDVVAASGEPFGDYSIFPTLLVSRLARENYKVMLSGDGGDELFWGYAKRFSDALNIAPQFCSPHWQRKLRWGVKKLTGVGTIDWQANAYKNIGAYYRRKHSRLSESVLADIFPGLPAWPHEYQQFDFAGCDPDTVAQWTRWNELTGHLTMVLLKVDRASMSQSLEVRVPLLDREVIATAARVDWRSCLDTGTAIGKRVLRQSLARHLSHQTQHKKGFEVPMSDWLRTSLKEPYMDLVVNSKSLMGMEVNRKAIYELFKRNEDRKQDLGWTLWPFLSLALWQDRFSRG